MQFKLWKKEFIGLFLIHWILIQRVFLPKQWGTALFHMPMEVHSVIAVPFSTKPSAHVDVHTEAKLYSLWGLEQTKDP